MGTKSKKQLPRLNHLFEGITWDKSKVEISQNFVAFSECMNFNKLIRSDYESANPVFTNICRLLSFHSSKLTKQISYWSKKKFKNQERNSFYFLAEKCW
jgi:hypothetical protein